LHARAAHASLSLILFVLLFIAFFHVAERVVAPTGLVIGEQPAAMAMPPAGINHLYDSGEVAASIDETARAVISAPTPATTGEPAQQVAPIIGQDGAAPDTADPFERSTNVTTQRGTLSPAGRLQEDLSGPERRPVRYALIAPPSPTALPMPSLAGAVRVPILMYHHIGDLPPGADAIRRDLTVSPAAFAQQMDYLSDSHYQTIGLGDLADYWFSGKPLPVKPIILTFDDGYDDNYTYAYAILRRHEFMGTFFVLTDAVGNAGYLTWEQIVVMDRHGMDIESHGRTHDDLAASSKEWATWQIAGSRNILEAKLGHQIRFYCYPSGRYTAETIAILKANGYVSAVSTAYGATHDKASLFNLTRVRVRGSDSLQEFIVKVTTAP